MITLDDLKGMFPGVITSSEEATIVAGLPSLNAAMVAGGINTPRRIAAFLTTLRFESRWRYNIHQIGDTRQYAGRGYIQLTGIDNYDSAGDGLGIDLVHNPDLALSIEWSAKIAVWYWTKARPRTNEYADNLQMGKVNAMIGYPLKGTNDANRCAAFALALAYLTGEPTPPVDCNR